MSANKSDKELAFLHDLYVATDWGERFAALIDEHVKLPKRGSMLYVASGTGGHALAMQERAGNNVSLICVDENEESLELARAKAMAVRADPEFRQAQLEALPFEDEQFDLVVSDASLVAVERLPEIISELVRVAAPGGAVALGLPTYSSFGEFFSVYWEALRNLSATDHEHDVESLITELPTIAAIETMLTREGLDNVASSMQIEEFEYESGEEFLNASLITDFLMKRWLESLPEEISQASASQEIARIIDAERQDMNFSLSVKATVIVGRKAK
ncbi:MAG TPA: class I SAM-dependent methyltransferase [Pyrinomonadaceae bacterium]|nr:class I SAM-dependent methyltransferase [Pyrinomonadaceae bacterium]